MTDPKVEMQRRGNKVIVHVNVYPDPQDPKGYLAIAQEMTSCWSKGKSIDECINQFKTEYDGLLKMMFANGEQFEFDFAVKLTSG